MYNDSDVGYYDEYDSPILSLEELIEQEEYIFEMPENLTIKNEE